MGQATPPTGLADVRSVGTGGSYTCVLRAAGVVLCWGYNVDGEINVPSGLASVQQLAVGPAHSCAVRTDSTLVCWGMNNTGQATPPADLAGISQVGLGASHSCAVTRRSVRCWGSNYYGEASAPGNLTDAIQVAVGDVHSCALRQTGTVTCWGSGLQGQLAIPASLAGVVQLSANRFRTCALLGNGAVQCWGRQDSGSLMPPADLPAAMSVSVGDASTCVVTADGRPACWGAGLAGANSAPIFDDIDKLSVGGGVTCAVRLNSTVVCWGGAENTQAPAGLTGVTQVTTGARHVCALKNDGTVLCWGDNSSSQLAVPSGLQSVVQVSAGNYFTCAVVSDGTVSCWGTTQYGAEHPPAELPPVRTISVGNEFVCAAKQADGAVVCWGWGVFGQTNPPQTLRDVTQLSSGSTHTCALTTSHALTCWGLISGERPPSAAPGIQQVAAGLQATCVLKDDATVGCWTHNQQYGAGSPPPGLVGVRQVSAYSSGTSGCAVESNRSVVCWGTPTIAQSAGAPTAIAGGPYSGDEGSPLIFDGTGSTDSNGGQLTYSWDFGDGVIGAGPTPTHTYTDQGVYAVTLTVTNPAGLSGQTTVSATIHNVSPTATWIPPVSTPEGTTFSLRLSAPFDPSAPDVAAGFTYAFDCGSGYSAFSSASSVECPSVDDAVLNVGAKIRDKDGGETAYAGTVTIQNVAPSISSLRGPDAPIQLISGMATASLSVTFADPAGVHDTYVAATDCGSGTSATVPVNSGTANSLNCVYASSGIYTVKTTVSDEDGGVSQPAQFQYVVVYDPTGAFTTGGGWFTSGQADCPSCGSASQKAHFAFNARFLPGQSTAPDGSARFWLASKQMEFRSTSLAMLVVSAGRVQFWGAGTLNGANGYTFRITATQGSAGSGGAFRIEIWDPQAQLVYDNQWASSQDAMLTRPIEAGQVAIQQP